MKQTMHIGIDFGTTNTTAVAIVQDKKGRRIQRLGEAGEHPFASAVAIPKNGGAWLFGRDVKRRRQELAADYHIVTSLKTFLNEALEIKTEQGIYSSVQVTAQFLSYIKSYIKKVHTIDINEAAFAFPIDFKPIGRAALQEAAELAGIKVKNFIYESTAAYIANRKQVAACSRVMTVDWGGGTLDISILELKGQELHELAVGGARIGGDDLDLLLAKYLHAKIALQSGSQTSLAAMSALDQDTLIGKAEEIKIGFTVEDEVAVNLMNYGEFGIKLLALDYGEFAELITTVLNEALQIIETAMQQANITTAGIDAVIITGGSTELRPFYTAMARIFGEQKLLSAEHKQWSVAIGTALISMTSGEYYLDDSVCVQLSDDYLYPVLEKGVAKVGYQQKVLEFSLTEDSPVANFIFKNSDGLIHYGNKSICSKGFLKEKLLLKASIGQDQIARIMISNPAMGKTYAEQHTIEQLKFYYDLSQLDF